MKIDVIYAIKGVRKYLDEDGNLLASLNDEHPLHPTNPKYEYKGLDKDGSHVFQKIKENE